LMEIIFLHIRVDQKRCFVSRKITGKHCDAEYRINGYRFIVLAFEAVLTIYMPFENPERSNFSCAEVKIPHLTLRPDTFNTVNFVPVGVSSENTFLLSALIPKVLEPLRQLQFGTALFLVEVLTYGWARSAAQALR
jgi:hypothetical protein